MDDAVTFPVQPEVLRQKIDDVYAAFAHRRLSFPFTYCDCCIKASQAKRFETVPLRELTSEDLWAAASNIPHTANTRRSSAARSTCRARSCGVSGAF
jgi:hypothetical protein